MNPSKNSTPKISIPKTADGCSPTITSSFGAGISVANLLGVDHFPKGGGTDNQKSMLISEFIQQLQDLCDNEGDMEIVIVTGNNGLGSTPHVKKSPIYDQFEIVK